MLRRERRFESDTRARAQHDRETEHQAEKFLNRLLEVRALIAANRAKAKGR